MTLIIKDIGPADSEFLFKKSQNGQKM